jgi:response regulator NasT
VDSARILIAMNDASASKLKSILNQNGINTIGQVSDGQECLRKVKLLGPDIVILEYDLPLLNGHEVSKVILDEKVCDVILIVNDSLQKNFVSDMTDEIGFVCIVKPVSKVTLVNTVELMIKTKRKIARLEKEIEDLKEVLNTRKEVEKAKGLLMKHLKLSEAEAFKRIQKQSMDKGISMREIAKAIVLAYDI